MISLIMLDSSVFSLLLSTRACQIQCRKDQMQILHEDINTNIVEQSSTALVVNL